MEEGDIAFTTTRAQVAEMKKKEQESTGDALEVGEMYRILGIDRAIRSGMPITVAINKNRAPPHPGLKSCYSNTSFLRKLKSQIV